MKVGRRGFLGLMAGGAVSVPKLAADFAGEAGFPPAMPSYSGRIIDSPDNSWKIGRIADLKGLLSGNHPSDDHNKRIRSSYLIEQRDRYRIDALRSVSMVNKHRMFHEAEGVRDDHRRRLEWEHELSQLTGGLL